MVRVQRHAPTEFYPWERQVTNFTGGWLCIRAGGNGRKISSQPVFDSGPSNPCSVAIPTELPAHIGSVYWDLFRDCNGVKHQSKYQKPRKNKRILCRKYMNLMSTLILSSTNCCYKRKYTGKSVIFIILLEFF